MGKWVLLQRHVWEQAHGQIPTGYIIKFKDGNNENCDLENLELISRKEHLRRNQKGLDRSELFTKLWASEKLREKYGLKRRTNLNVVNY